MKHLALSFTFAVLIFTVGAKKGYFARKPTKPSPAPVVETGWSNEWVDSKFLNITPDESKHLIVDKLKPYIENDTVFMEITSGRSRYISYFAENFPYVTFKLAHFKRLEKVDTAFDLNNIKEAVFFDITSSPKSWFRGEIRNNKTDYMFTTTMVNTVPMKNTSNLFHAAALYLKPDAYLFLYGIFKMNGKVACMEAWEIDKELRRKNYLLGIREITQELIQQAYVYGLYLEMSYELPNCHQILAWRKDDIGIPMD